MECTPTIDIDWSPNSVPDGLYKKLFFRWPSGLKANETLPRIRCVGSQVLVDAENVSAYRFVTQSKPNENIVPLMYPHALFGSAHLMMIGHEKFPLGAIGLLHLRNHILQARPFGFEQPWEMSCEIARQRHVEKGLEFDFDSTVSIDGELVWQSVSTYLKRGKPLGDTEESPLAGMFPAMQKDNATGEFGVPHNIGKRYAKVTGDYNPIHVSSIAAKLFGFRRAIAHGMWSVARSIQELPDVDDKAPIRHDVVFKGPMYVASQAAIKTNSHGRFDIFCGTNDRPVIVGTYRSAAADEILV